MLSIDSEMPLRRRAERTDGLESIVVWLGVVSGSMWLMSLICRLS